MTERIEIAIGEKPLEEVNGDTLFISKMAVIILLVYLWAGHGKSAHGIASTTRRFLKQFYQTDLAELMEQLHNNDEACGGVAIIANLDVESLC